MREVGRRLGKPIQGFTAESAALLQTYGWPGNIRELQNVVERAAILCREDRIGPTHLNLAPPAAPVSGGSKTLKDLEREAILAALDAHGGNRRRAAEQLGIGLRTLYARLKEYGIFTEAEANE
jgi:two-component system response regulator FlrC